MNTTGIGEIRLCRSIPRGTEYKLGVNSMDVVRIPSIVPSKGNQRPDRDDVAKVARVPA